MTTDELKLPISVNVCVLNEQENIEACIEGIKANQATEIIIVDGGSSDDTVDIARKNGCTVVVSDKRGLSSQRQLGIENSSQPYIAIVDADDELPDNFLRTMLDELRENDLDAIQGIKLSGDDNTYWEKAMSSTMKVLNGQGAVELTNMLGRPALYKSSVIKYCGFDSFFDGVGCEDTDLSIRMELNCFLQGTGTATSVRKHSSKFSEVFKKIRKYGRGDAHICSKYPHKRSQIVFHLLIRYPILRAWAALKNGHIAYIPFFMMMGWGRFIFMVTRTVKLKLRGHRYGMD